MTDRELDRDAALEALNEKATDDADEYHIPAADFLPIWEIGLTIYLTDRDSK